MKNWIIYGLLFIICCPALHKGYAQTSSIDSMATKEDVQKFLVANLGNSGVFLLTSFSPISRAEKRGLYFSEPDTVTVEDPVSDKQVIKALLREFDTGVYCYEYHENGPEGHSNYPIDEVISFMYKYPFRFYKRDIDGNGHTDLIIDAGVLLVVMDKGSKFEGHILARCSLHTFRFKDFTSLPDGSLALQLMYDSVSGDSVVQRLFKTIDTIVYKFDGFEKYNPSYKPVGISKIRYQYDVSVAMVGIDGSDCMEINKNGQCTMVYRGRHAYFSGTLDCNQLEQLWSQVSYINVKSKRNSYDAGIDHAAGGAIVVYFDDGSVKRISSWAWCPAIDIGYLSKRLSDISKIIHWQPCGPLNDMDIQRFYMPLELESVEYCTD